MCSTLPDMKTVDQKIRQIKALPKYSPIPSMLIYALISSSFTIFFGGSLPDAAVSGMIGIGIRCVELLLQPLPLNRFLLVVLLSTVSGCMAASCVYTNAMFSLDKDKHRKYHDLDPWTDVYQLYQGNDFRKHVIRLNNFWKHYLFLLPSPLVLPLLTICCKRRLVP